MQAPAEQVITPVGGRSVRRRDLWWFQPLLTVSVLGAFVIYGLWVTFQNQYYEIGPYLSPFYSPFIKPGWWPFSPAILILWMPLGFRVTCYYYRKAYYRSFLWDPPACAVGELRKGYQGERRFPFILQNLHRYFFYLGLVVVGFLWYDAIRSFFFEDGFGVGVGSLVLVGNILLLSLYTFSCHSFRHLSGGCEDCLAAKPVRHKLWSGVSALNTRHALWAWLSLFSVSLADVYIRLYASGAINDVRIF